MGGRKIYLPWTVWSGLRPHLPPYDRSSEVIINALARKKSIHLGGHRSDASGNL